MKMLTEFINKLLLGKPREPETRSEVLDITNRQIEEMEKRIAIEERLKINKLLTKIFDERNEPYFSLLYDYQRQLKASARYKSKYLRLHQEMKKYRDLARALEEALAKKNRNDMGVKIKLMEKLRPVCSHKHSAFALGCDICGVEER